MPSPSNQWYACRRAAGTAGWARCGTACRAARAESRRPPRARGKSSSRSCGAKPPCRFGCAGQVESGFIAFSSRFSGFRWPSIRASSQRLEQVARARPSRSLSARCSDTKPCRPAQNTVRHRLGLARQHAGLHRQLDGFQQHLPGADLLHLYCGGATLTGSRSSNMIR